MPVYYPPTGFHFKVEFQGVPGMGTDTEQRFQEVSGLTFEVETEQVNEGGENRFSYKFPKRLKFPNLVLKRGLLKGTALMSWFKSAISTYFTVVVYDFKPADIIITLMNDAGEPTAIWSVSQAYPLKWSISDFRAADNSIVVESIELAYQYFERKM